MSNRELTSLSYKKLVSDIAELYQGAHKALVEAYWKIGQRIVEEEQKGAIKAAYGTRLLAKISEDLSQKLGSGFSERNLERMRGFYLQNRISTPASKLSLAHHFALLPIQDKKKRLQLETKAIREGLKRDELRALVRHELVREQVAENLSNSEEKDSEPPELLTPVRGTLYAYRIVQPKLVGETDSELLVDLGFSSYLNLNDISSKKFALDDIVTSVKDSNGNYKLSAISAKPASLFTYRAEVEKVVDGDTLRVIVDLGFGIKTRQYLRLRGLDCPEMDTPEGKKAAEFVRTRIKVASEIVLTSSRSDKYDRYLADVYFTGSDGKERYLNNLLLEHGFAVNMSE
ncbi:MAG: DUF1016 N-terminal domain-containing protein [Candidatus Omnitrophota bacterium]